MTDKVCLSEFSFAKLDDFVYEIGFRELTEEETVFAAQSYLHIEQCKICQSNQATMFLEIDKMSFNDNFGPRNFNPLL